MGSSTDVHVIQQERPGEARLRTLRESGLLTDDYTEPFDRLTRLTRRLLNVDTALISLVGEDRQTFKGQDGVRPDLAEERGSPVSHSYCKFAVATGERLVITDARLSPLVQHSPAITERDAIAYAGIPIRLAQGDDVLGTLCVVHSQPREWTDDELGTLAELAEIARTELDYRVRSLGSGQVEELALRLPEPVSQLGDAIRSTASLIEKPEDPRLPRTVDAIQGRLQVVETIAADLGRVADSQRRTRRPQPQLVDLRERLLYALDLPRSHAYPEDIVAQVPDDVLPVHLIRRDLDRALAMAVVTATLHARIGTPVHVSLSRVATQATLRVVSPGNAVPVAELLRVVGAFQQKQDAHSLDVAVRSSGTRVRGTVAEAFASRRETTLVASFLVVPPHGTAPPSRVGTVRRQ